MDPQELWLKQTIGADRVRRYLVSDRSPIREQPRRVRRVRPGRAEEA